jgi:hypothetical protein
MSGTYAEDFGEIPQALAANEELRKATLQLVTTASIHAKVVEGQGRLDALREIMRQLVNGAIDVQGAIRETEAKLPRRSSTYAGDNRVFPNGWAERLVRTQLSRYYVSARSTT